MISILITLVVLGLVLWAVGQIPMDPAIMRIIRVVAVVLCVLWLLSVFFGYGPAFPVVGPRYR